jgi:hypothetical protein
MAAGSYSTAAAFSVGAQLTLAEQWNGKAWLVRKTPSPGDVPSGLPAGPAPRPQPAWRLAATSAAATRR